MLQIRKVPEDRIKTLHMSEIAQDNIPRDIVRDIICDRMGKEIARKLFEFNKVSEHSYIDGATIYRADVEVIVPTGAPEMPKIAGDPLTKVTLNLFTRDVQLFKEQYGQGFSEKIREAVHEATAPWRKYDKMFANDLED